MESTGQIEIPLKSENSLFNLHNTIKKIDFKKKIKESFKFNIF